MSTSGENTITLSLNPLKHDSLRVLTCNKRAIDAILAESLGSDTCVVQIGNFRYSIDEAFSSVKERVYDETDDSSICDTLKELHTDLSNIHTDLGTTIHTDLGTTLHTDLGTIVHTDLGTTIHDDLGDIKEAIERHA